MRQCAPDGRRQAHRLYTATKTGGQRLPRHNTSSSSPCLAMVTTTMITPGSLPPTQEEARLRMLSGSDLAKADVGTPASLLCQSRAMDYRSNPRKVANEP